MNQFNKKFKYVAVIAILFYQFGFSNIAYAYTLSMSKASDSFLAIANSPQAIMFDSHNIKMPSRLPISASRKAHKTVKVTITAYSSTVDQCDGDPFITANGTHVRDGIVAANFLPFGTKVKIPELYGEKIFTVEDRMNARYYYKIDIWMPTREQAKQFGVKYVEVEIY